MELDPDNKISLRSMERLAARVEELELTVLRLRKYLSEAESVIRRFNLGDETATTVLLSMQAQIEQLQSKLGTANRLLRHWPSRCEPPTCPEVREGYIHWMVKRRGAWEQRLAHLGSFFNGTTCVWMSSLDGQFVMKADAADFEEYRCCTETGSPALLPLVERW